MSRRYDSRTTIFSPEGRLYQVVYALEAISHAGTALGILAQDGIVLAAERKVTSKLLEQDTSAEKLYILNDNMICAVAGMTADANILINYARQAAPKVPPHLQRRHSLRAARSPFMRYSSKVTRSTERQFQLYQSNPSGDYGGWKATSVGANNASAQSLLKQDYKEECDLKEACGLAVKVLSKTMDSTKLSSEKIYVHDCVRQTRPVLTSRSRVRDRRKDQVSKIYHHLWSADEIDALLKEHGLARVEDHRDVRT
ncbi:unnamed protein product [Alternaria alternata]